MSTRPYATHGGLRIRQCYNKAVIRYREWLSKRAPSGACPVEWEQWRDWCDARQRQLREDRDVLIADAEQRQRRSKRNGRTAERRNGSAASAANP